MLDRLARRIVLGKLAALRKGRVIVHERGVQVVYGNSHDASELTATITVHSPAFYSDIAFGGSVGAGEAYINGHWACDEVETLVRILLQNRDVMDNMDKLLMNLNASDLPPFKLQHTTPPPHFI